MRTQRGKGKTLESALKLLKDIEVCCHGEGLLISMRKWQKLESLYGEVPLLKDIKAQAAIISFGKKEVNRQ